MTTDINIINVNGLDYPIKDREARTIAESAVTMFAYYEPGLVASQSYSKVGTLIFWKDALYETLTTVAKGEIWEVGVNLSPSIKAGAILSELKDELTANGNRIYMDYQNGKYGYNTSPNRGADTFFPFRDATAILIGSFDNNGTLDVASVLPDDYKDLTADDFLIRSPKMSATAWGNNIAGSTASSCSSTQSFTYDAETGILTISGCYAYGEGRWEGSVDSKCTCTLSGYVYAIL